VDINSQLEEYISPGGGIRSPAAVMTGALCAQSSGTTSTATGNLTKNQKRFCRERGIDGQSVYHFKQRRLADSPCGLVPTSKPKSQGKPVRTDWCTAIALKSISAKATCEPARNRIIGMANFIIC